MKSIITCCLIVGLFMGCAVNREGIKQELATRVDPMSVRDTEKYYADLEECAEYVAREIERVQNARLAGALAGAMIGAGVGYGMGSMYSRTTAQRAAAYGSMAGAAGGMANVPNRMYIIGWNCLIHRGYLLLW